MRDALMRSVAKLLPTPQADPLRRMKIDLALESFKDRQLALPLGIGSPAFERRNALMANLSNGRGWRVPRKTPEVDAQGRTRGDRKRALREQANSIIKAADARKHALREQANSVIKAAQRSKFSKASPQA